jgi:hypothetical protein
LKVIVASPRAFASLFVTGGTTLAALSCAVNTSGPVLVFVGVVGLSLPQAAAISKAIAMAPIRFTDISSRR